MLFKKIASSQKEIVNKKVKQDKQLKLIQSERKQFNHNYKYNQNRINRSKRIFTNFVQSSKREKKKIIQSLLNGILRDGQYAQKNGLQQRMIKNKGRKVEKQKLNIIQIKENYKKRCKSERHIRKNNERQIESKYNRINQPCEMIIKKETDKMIDKSVKKINKQKESKIGEYKKQNPTKMHLNQNIVKITDNAFKFAKLSLWSQTNHQTYFNKQVHQRDKNIQTKKSFENVQKINVNSQLSCKIIPQTDKLNPLYDSSKKSCCWKFVANPFSKIKVKGSQNKIKFDAQIINRHQQNKKRLNKKENNNLREFEDEDLQILQIKCSKQIEQGNVQNKQNPTTKLNISDISIIEQKPLYQYINEQSFSVQALEILNF